MKKLTLATVAAVGLLVGSSPAMAADMYIDVGDPGYELDPPNAADANTTTGVFEQFGFNQILATSIYDFSDGSVFGDFYDTNIASELNDAGVPTSGTALDNATFVNLVMPNCPGPKCDLDDLSPLLNTEDTEGFSLTWDLQVQYHFDGVLTATGPEYTGGFFEIYFNDYADDTNDRLVLTGNLTGSDINFGNLDLFFDISFAEAGFLFIDKGGVFLDASTQDKVTLSLDTNVQPPIPTADQLLLVTDINGNDNAIRQAELDGSIRAEIPEPGTLALFGLGLLGLGATARRKFS